VSLSKIPHNKGYRLRADRFGWDIRGYPLLAPHQPSQSSEASLHSAPSVISDLVGELWIVRSSGQARG